MQANLDAFERWRIVPRMLRDVSERDLAHVGARRRRCRRRCCSRRSACSRSSTPKASSRARARPPRWACRTSSARPRRTRSSRSPRRWGRAARWYQLYWPRERELAASFVARAERAGYEAIVLTLDTWFLGWRPRDLQQRLPAVPQRRGRGQLLQRPGVPRRRWRSRPRRTRGRRSATGPTSSPTRRSRWDGPRVAARADRAADRAEGDRARRGRAARSRRGRRRRDRVQPRRAPGRRRDRRARRAAGDPRGRRRASCRCCSTAACARAPTCSRRSRSAPTRCASGGRTCGGSRSTAQAGVEHVLRCLLAELDLTLALSGYTAIAQVDRAALARRARALTADGRALAAERFSSAIRGAAYGPRR